MNPGLSHMMDDQIRQAADQMEMMANNPAMMQQAKEQMKNMNQCLQMDDYWGSWSCALSLVLLREVLLLLVVWLVWLAWLVLMVLMVLSLLLLLLATT
jgi:hypothetical protein